MSVGIYGCMDVCVYIYLRQGVELGWVLAFGVWAWDGGRAGEEGRSVECEEDEGWPTSTTNKTSLPPPHPLTTTAYTHPHHYPPITNTPQLRPRPQTQLPPRHPRSHRNHKLAILPKRRRRPHARASQYVTPLHPHTLPFIYAHMICTHVHTCAVRLVPSIPFASSFRPREVGAREVETSLRP